MLGVDVGRNRQYYKFIEYSLSRYEYSGDDIWCEGLEYSFPVFNSDLQPPLSTEFKNLAKIRAKLTQLYDDINEYGGITTA